MKTLSVLYSLLAVLMILACNFYKPISKNPADYHSTVLSSMNEKVFIYRTPIKNFVLNKMIILPESEQISAILANVPPEYQTYINAVPKRFKYFPPENGVLKEVHLYGTLEPGKDYGDTVLIPIQDILKMEVIVRDKERSRRNTTLAAISIPIVTIAIIGTIVALTKDSCPFISVYDGNNYFLQGETFGGAVYPTLARADFVPLPAAAIGREVNLMISNELKEKQYTDYADILLVTHQPDQKIVISPNGELWQIIKTMKPQTALLNANIDVTEKIRETDNRNCTFNDTSINTAVNKLTLTFNYPGENQTACLVLDLRNTYWLDDTYNKATSKLGSNYNAWIEQQKQQPASTHIAWQEMQHLPLTISINTPQGWREIRKLKTIGPLMNREVAIPLGMLPQGKEIEIALSTGFMFWELDKAQLATVEKVHESAVKTIKPSLATDETGNNVLQPLLQADGQYLEQHEAGKRAYIIYKVPAYSKAKAYSAFLHTYGYYEPIREFEGPTDHAFLEAMTVPGAFTDYSKSRYREFIRLANLASNQSIKH